MSASGAVASGSRGPRFSGVRDTSAASFVVSGMITTLLVAFIVLCIVGLILWGVNQIPGIPQIIKVVLYVIVGVILLLWLLQYVQGAHISLR